MSRRDLSHIGAVFFDLDDTLCTYWDASKKALRETFEAHGPPGFTAEEMVGHWAEAFRGFVTTIKDGGWYPVYLKNGEPTRTEQMRLTLRQAGIEDEALAQTLSQAYMERRDANLTLFEDALQVLETLGARYPMGLITNGPADIQRQEIATLGIERFFGKILIEGEVGEGKPKATPFRLAQESVGLPPERMLMVGNSYAHDVAAALACGWHAIWIRRPSDVAPSSKGPEEMPPGGPEPDAIIGNLRELLQLIPS